MYACIWCLSRGYYHILLFYSSYGPLNAQKKGKFVMPKQRQIRQRVVPVNAVEAIRRWGAGPSWTNFRPRRGPWRRRRPRKFVEERCGEIRRKTRPDSRRYRPGARGRERRRRAWARSTAEPELRNACDRPAIPLQCSSHDPTLGEGGWLIDDFRFTISELDLSQRSAAITKSIFPGWSLRLR